MKHKIKLAMATTLMAVGLTACVPAKSFPERIADVVSGAAQAIPKADPSSQMTASLSDCVTAEDTPAPFQPELELIQYNLQAINGAQFLCAQYSTHHDFAYVDIIVPTDVAEQDLIRLQWYASNPYTLVWAE